MVDPQTTEETFDRREQRAIGHFIFLAKEMMKKRKVTFRIAVEELQREYACYDRI